MGLAGLVKEAAIKVVIARTVRDGYRLSAAIKEAQQWLQKGESNRRADVEIAVREAFASAGQS